MQKTNKTIFLAGLLTCSLPATALLDCSKIYVFVLGTSVCSGLS